MPKLRPLQCTAALALLLAATAAHAQAPPAAPPPPAAGSPALYTEKLSLARPPVANRYAGNLSLGASLNGGNTQSYAGTLGGRFQLNRDRHQLTAEAIGSWAGSHQTEFDDVILTASNTMGRLRYDVFLTENDALFVALAPRRDPFAGLGLRLQTQAGYARNLYAPADNHRLWGEVGYDGTYDNFSKTPTGQTPAPATRPDSEFIHSTRLFVGYTNLLTPLASLNLGLEWLYDVQDSENNRVNALIEVTSSLSQRFKLSLLTRILYDQKPVEGKTEKTDYISTAQLVYTFDSYSPPSPCPACDCTKDVAAARASCASTVSPADTTVAPPAASVPPAPAPVAP
jgi:putative salt-induced outer membrane protein YdiY